MKKVIRLSESDLINIVKRVINESNKNILSESFEYGAVKMSALNKEHGGPVVLTYKGKSIKYSIDVVVKKSILGKILTAYNGPIAVVALWKDPAKGYFAKDNTDKVFQLPLSELKKMADAAKNNSKQVNIAGTGEIAGIEGQYSATMTRIA